MLKNSNIIYLYSIIGPDLMAFITCLLNKESSNTDMRTFIELPERLKMSFLFPAPR